MAFASVQKNGGVAITPRTVMRVERPLSVNSGHNTSTGSGGGSNNKPVAGAGAGAAVSAPVRPKSASPSSSTAYHRRSSSGSVGKNGFDTTAGLITKKPFSKAFQTLSLSPSPSLYMYFYVFFLCLCHARIGCITLSLTANVCNCRWLFVSCCDTVWLAD
jgi:hypothetical protein